jgi:hypothetical protein
MTAGGIAAKPSDVSILRDWTRSHGGWTIAIFAVALLLRIAIPAGLMPATDAAGRITVGFCSGIGAGQVTIGIPGLDHEREDHGSRRWRARTRSSSPR